MTTRSERRSNFRLRLLVFFLALLVIPYGRQLATSPTAGQDFRAFYAAATLLARHQDPYDWARLGPLEDQLYNQAARLQPGSPRYYDFQPYPEGPWLAMALVPFTGLPWQIDYAGFALLMALATLIGAWLMASAFSWPERRRWALAVCLLLSPVGFLSLFQGQVTPIVFLSAAAACWLAKRQQGLLAGLVLACVWVKPNLGIVLPLVLALLYPLQAWRLLRGFALGSVPAFFLAWLAIPGVLLGWPAEVVHQWRSLQGAQPDVASINSFYYPALSGWPKLAALALVLSAAAAYGFVSFRRLPDPQRRGFFLLLLWIALLPYVHSYDTVLLFPVLAYLLRPDLAGWRHPAVEVAVWLFATVPFAYFIGLHLGYFNGFTAIPVAALLYAWHRHVVARQRPGALTEAA